MMLSLSRAGLSLMIVSALAVLIAGCGKPAPNKTQTQDFLNAVARHDYDQTKSSLEEYSNKELLSARDDSGLTPLHRAAITGDLKLVKLLISKGADVNAQGHKALDPNDTACAILNSYPGNIFIPYGATPLDVADISGMTETARLLQSHGGHPGKDKPFPDSTSQDQFLQAIVSQDAKQLRALLAQYSNSELLAVTTEDGLSPLHLAAAQDDTDTIKLFLEKGAKTNRSIEKATQLSIRKMPPAKPDEFIFDYMGRTRNIPPVVYKIPKGATPLKIAEITKSKKAVSLLQKYTHNKKPGES